MRRNKIAAAIAFPALLAALLAGCSLFEDPEPEAEFTIDKLDQTHYEHIHSWGAVAIDYTIRNTGPLDLKGWSVDFRVECTNGAVYKGKHTGNSVAIAEEATGWTAIDTGGLRYADVTVADYELTAE